MDAAELLEDPGEMVGRWWATPPLDITALPLGGAEDGMDEAVEA